MPARDPWEEYRRDVRYRYAGLSAETLVNLVHSGEVWQAALPVNDHLDVLLDTLRAMAAERAEEEQKAKEGG
jgi:hypothetical protein